MAETNTTSNKEGGREETENHSMEKSRKEKRKERKKMKRKHLRKEAAEREREMEEARLNDPEEQKRIEREEEDERESRDRALKEFKERERAWIEAMERKMKAQEEEEEQRAKDLEEIVNREQVQNGNECDEGDDWEYVEEGPAEIIWQGNEIIVRKKKVRVPKKDANQTSKKEDADRPTSNPLPPQSEVFADYLHASSAQQMLENVAKEVPNFGTEQDKAHCPFHLKTGACRFGQRCSRVHFYPDKSCTLLIRNMYNGPGIAWEQDEGLEYTDEEVERFYEEFYEDVHTEFLKFGEIVNFKVCKNGSFHLRGNVYVHYKSLESAVLAYHSVNCRYFAGKQVKCEFVNVTRWKVAICGEFMKSRFKTCSHGTACNFIHCFRNPGGDYEWADWDKPPPRYWIKKMAALFGYSDESGFGKESEHEHLGQSRNSSKMITANPERNHSRRSRSRDMDLLISGSGRGDDDEEDLEEKSSQGWKHSNDDKKQIKDERVGKERSGKYIHHGEKRHGTTSDDGSCSDLDGDRDRGSDRVRHNRARKRSKQHSKELDYSTYFEDPRNRAYEVDSSEDSYDRHGHTKRTSRQQSKMESVENDVDNRNRMHEADRDQLDRDRETHHNQIRRSSRHQSKVASADGERGRKNRTHEPDSFEKQLNRERRRGRLHHHISKSLGHQDNFSEYLNDHVDVKNSTHDSDSTDDGLDQNIRRSRTRTRKHSRRLNEISEHSDSLGHEVKKLKGILDSKRHSSCRHSPRLETNEASSSHKNSKSRGNYDSRDFDRYESNDVDVEQSGYLDLWKPRSPEKDLEENASGELDRWKPESPEEDQSTRIETVGYSAGLDHVRSGRKRRSDLTVKEHSPEENEEYEENHKRRSAKHRSHG